MADRSRQWEAGLDGTPEVSDVMPIAPQAVRISPQPQTVRDEENAYPAFDDRYRQATEGAGDALRTGARSWAPYIYFTHVARTRVGVCGLYGSVRKFCGHVRLWRGPHATRQDHPYYPGNAERGKRRRIATKGQASHSALRTLSPSPAPSAAWSKIKQGDQRPPNPCSGNAELAKYSRGTRFCPAVPVIFGMPL